MTLRQAQGHNESNRIMKNKDKTIETLLRETRFLNLSEREADQAWGTISQRIESSGAFSSLPTKRKTMIPLLIGALLFASAGGTVAASNSAVPGDKLYGIDRAVESVRVALAREDSSNELRLRFAEERLLEVQALVERARAKANATSTATTTATTTASSTVTTTPGRSGDKVAHGVDVALSYLNEVSAKLAASGNTEAVARLALVIERLETIANSDYVRVQLKNDGAFKLRLKGAGDSSASASSSSDVKINTSGNKGRIEVKEIGEKIRFEILENGDMRVKSQTDIDNDDEDDDDNDDEDDGDDRSSRGRGNGVDLNSNLRIDLR